MVTTHISRETDIKKEAFIARLEKFLADQENAFEVLVQPYGKPPKGVRYTVIRANTKKGSDPQVLTGTYDERALQKRTVQELASGPIGRLTQILRDSDANN